MTRRIAAVLLVAVWLSECSGGEDVGPRREACPPGPRAPQPPARVNTTARLARLRVEMRRENSVRGPTLDAFIVTSDDEHQSEYVASRDRRREYITGFSGSNGDAVITRRLAALWTDGRYFRQADKQLGCDWLLMRDGQPDVPSMTDWLRHTLRAGSKVGADSNMVPHTHWVAWSKELALSNISLVEVGNNVIDNIWTTGRQGYPAFKAYTYDVAYAGATWQSKVEALRTELHLLGASAMVVTALDEVAWLLNVRGYDIPFNPFLRAFVVVEAERVHLYADAAKLSEGVRRQLKMDNCFDSPYCTRVHPYGSVVSDIRTFAQAWKKVVLPDACVYTKGASHAIYMAVPAEKRIQMASPVIFMKAGKNPSEVAGMRAAHVRDGVALCDFLAELEESMSAGDQWSEWNVSMSVDQYRREQNLSRGISFATIAGFARHGTQPHYEATEASSLRVDGSSTLVLDSGGQYEDGTTDVTRTLHYGTPTALHREAYTRVLMGQIALAALVFPANVTTTMVDVLARGPLWRAGMDYLHGTGHGIGAFLAVHESPINIGYKTPPSQWIHFKEGYFFSDEPGYYHKNEFGVRLENVLEVVKVTTKHNVSGPYYGFRPSTLVPYEPKLIDVSMLTSEHRHWLNEYNTQVRNVVGAELKKQMRMRGFYWMMEKTAYIPEHCFVRATAASLYRHTALALFVSLAGLGLVLN